MKRKRPIKHSGSRPRKSLPAPSGSRRFQMLVDSIRDYAVYLLDADGHVHSWNSGAQRFKGYTEEEIVGQHFSRFYTPEDREAGLPERALGAVVNEGKFEGEGWRVRKDGTRFWASVVIDPVLDENGELVGFAKVTRDISDKKAGEQAWLQSEQRFRMLVQGVRDYAIYMLDPTGVITNWNAVAEAIKGYRADEIVGQHFSRFYTDEDRASGEPERALQTAVSEGKYEKEALRVRKDGTRFWASVLVDPIYDDTGVLVGFAKITRDITERRRAQEEIEKAREALAQAQKMEAIGRLTGGVAHDFNNLLTIIRSSVDMLRRATLSEEKRARYFDAIAETADRAALLTGQLLAFARRQPLRPELFDVAARIRGLEQIIATSVGSPIKVELDVGGDINTTTGLRVGGNLVCSTTCTPGGGSGNYIQNGTLLQSANFAIQSALNTSIAALIRGASGQSADLLRLVAGDSGLTVTSSREPFSSDTHWPLRRPGT